jgi:hypothetical protein
MGESIRSEVFGWALGTLHATLFVLAIVVSAFRAGGLDDLLGGLNTLLGLGLYGGLWMLTWWTTTRAVAGVDWRQVTAEDTGKLLLRGLRWGGATGVLVLLAVAVLLLANAMVGGIQGGGAGTDALVGIAVASTTGLLIGSLVAFVLGGVVGVAFALIDVAALLACRRLLG